MSRKLIHLTETDSTNNFLRDLLTKEKLEEGTTVYSDYQTIGKGQRGNTWISERGKNLLFSIVLYPSLLQADEQFILSQLISVSIRNVLSGNVTDISIKWPNDIYWKDKKICGILIENDLSNDAITQSVIGVGVNLNQLFSETSFNPVSLKEITKTDYDHKEILNQIVEELFSLYNPKKSNYKDLTCLYKNYLYRKKGVFPYQDTLSGKHFNASIKDIDVYGRLILETENGEKIFGFKEVKFL